MTIDYNEILLGKKIINFLVKRDKDYDNNIISVAIDLNDYYLVININPDYDNLEFQILKSLNIDRYAKYPKFENFPDDSKIISYWIPQNHLEFYDCFILGLNQFVPTIIISAISSHIKIGLVNY